MKHYGKPTRRKPRLDWNQWLFAYYGHHRDDGDDLILAGPCGPDRHLMHAMLTQEWRWPSGAPQPSFIEELDRRGYDITTLRFEIKRKPQPPEGGAK